MSHTTPVSGEPHTRAPARRPSRAARRMKNHTPPDRGSAGGPYRQPERSPADPSGDISRPELHADAWSHRLRRLRDAVLPGPLAGATHDDQVSVPDREPQALTATGAGASQGAWGSAGHPGGPSGRPARGA